MQTIKGKFNQARIMIPEHEHLDHVTYDQIHRFLEHPAFEGESISIMPDSHAGKGSVIGFTMPLGDKIVPNVVGVDIGCGVLSLRLGRIDIDLEQLDDFILKSIPYGFKVRKQQHFYLKQYSDLLKEIKRVSELMGQDEDRVLCSLGSLGGGNHFIELGRDESRDFWLTIHSGSRHFGLSVAEHYQSLAVERMRKQDNYSKDLAWLSMTNGGEDYLRDMNVAQDYAKINRELIARDICTYLELEYDKIDSVQSVHNYIDFDDRIIRKGAIRSCEANDLVIPFNMLDGLIIGKGYGNKMWNYSAPHGAGRLLSRRKAKEKLNLDKVKQDMKKAGIYSRSLNKNSLDEAAGAYKDKDMIMEALKDVVEVKHFVKPVYNFKDH